MNRCVQFSALSLVLLLTACSSVGPLGERDDYDEQKGPLLFKSATYRQVPQSQKADWSNALQAFVRSCTTMGNKPVWQSVCARALTTNADEAKAFFENEFVPWKVVRDDDKKGLSDNGLMTGYYEPMLRGSLTKTKQYRYPVYGVPNDLIAVDLTSLHPQLKGLRLRGKVVGRKLVPYDTRAGIENRKDMSNNVLCWADDPIDVFFLQIQGSGRVMLPDGTFIRIGFRDQNGHTYKAIGQWLIRNAGLTPEEMSMQRIRQWVRDNPRRSRELLNYNPSYVFFEKKEGLRDEEGPVGAQGVPLTAGASVAVDRRFWSLGVPFLVQVEQTNPDMSYVRPVVAQDTGGAIRGPIRFDYFWGYGDLAGKQAGQQKSNVNCWVLVPKGFTPRDVM
jgi:membrane-bound lytic murein transglycosylase A